NIDRLVSSNDPDKAVKTEPDDHPNGCCQTNAADEFRQSVVLLEHGPGAGDHHREAEENEEDREVVEEDSQVLPAVVVEDPGRFLELLSATGEEELDRHIGDEDEDE